MVLVGTQNESTRTAWLEKTLKKIPKGKKILDVGAGECQFKKFCTHLDYLSQDFGKYDGLGDRRGLQTGSWNYAQIDIVSDITSIPQPDRSFDAILCTEVFEHLPEPILAVKEFARLLKKGGHLIITAPFCSLTHLSPQFYYTGFSQNFFETILPKYGFKIVQMVPNGNYFEYLAQELRRLRSVAKDYTRLEYTLWEKLAEKIYLNLLEKLSLSDTHSDELLYYDTQVLARKAR